MISQYVSVNRKFEVAFFSSVKRALDAKVKAVIAVIRSHGLAYARTHLHVDIANEQLHDVIKRLYVTVGLRHARMNQQRLSTEKSMPVLLQQKRLGYNETWTNFILAYLRQFLTSKITFEVNETLRNRLLRELQTGIDEGLGIDDMVNRLRDTDLTSVQTARIIRTEVNRSANVGARAQADTFQFQLLKEWIAVHDKRTRGNKPSDHANHLSLDGTTIDMENVFIDPRNGDRLAQPGDPSASAESVINCRCQMGTKAKRDKDGNLIPKRQFTSVIFPGQINRPQTITI